LTEKLKLDATAGNPWVNISVYPLKPVPKEEAPGYAAAIGLALRGLEND
jgi:Tfp pilus assembly PilM family ATPase